jgi:hypothetical protein
MKIDNPATHVIQPLVGRENYGVQRPPEIGAVADKINEISQIVNWMKSRMVDKSAIEAVDNSVNELKKTFEDICTPMATVVAASETPGDGNVALADKPAAKPAKPVKPAPTPKAGK